MSGPAEQPNETGAVRPLIRSTVLLEHSAKRCRKCGAEKPRTEYYHHGKDGLCKPCYWQQTMAWRKANPKKAKAIKSRYQKSPKGRAASRKDNALTRLRHPKEVAAAKAASYAKKRPMYLARCSRNQRRYIEEAAPFYVRRLLVRGTAMRPDEAPESLIQLKARILKIKRYAKRKNLHR